LLKLTGGHKSLPLNAQLGEKSDLEWGASCGAPFFPMKAKKTEKLFMRFTVNPKYSYLIIKIIIFSTGMFLICGSIAVCANETSENGENDKHMAQKPIEEVLKEHTNRLMSLPGVSGTAQSLCERQPCIKVFVIKKTPELEQKIPSVLGGYPVVIQETGKFRALPENQD
jgi:hypothetical protein